MATVKQYALNLWKAQKVVVRKLGMDITWGGPADRVRFISDDIMLAGLIKILVDKGVITDADLTSAYNAITNMAFPSLPVVPRPDLDGGGAADDPDLGG